MNSYLISTTTYRSFVLVGQGDGQYDGSDSEDEGKAFERLAMLRLDDWIKFRVDPEASSLIINLRQKWHALFLRRMRGPAKPWSQMDDVRNLRLYYFILLIYYPAKP